MVCVSLDSHLLEFQRDMGCTEAEWLGWLPAALDHLPWQRDGNEAQVVLGEGQLWLHWQVVSPRVIGLVRIPRLLVRYRFVGVSSADREAFLQRFDLHMHRGGG